VKPTGARIVLDVNTSEQVVSETSLLLAAQAGDRVALGRLLSPHQPCLYSLCRSMLGHAEDAEDAVQETFYRAVRALNRFRPEARVKTWLFRIAVNVCLDRKEFQSRSHLLEASEVEYAAPYSLEAATLTRLQLDQALANLMPRHRAVFLLREEQGWSVVEIAESLQCTQRRVNNELYRARRILKEWLQRHGQEGGAR